MQFLGWMSEATSQFGEGYTTVDRAVSTIWDLLGFLIIGSGDPLDKLASEGDAQALSNPTLRLAALVLIVLRIAKGETFQDWARQDVLDMLYGWDTVPPLQTVPADPADLISRRMLSVRWHARDKDDDPSSTLDASLGVEHGAGAEGPWRARRVRRLQRRRRPRVRPQPAAARARAVAGHRAAAVVHRRRRARRGAGGHARGADDQLAGHAGPQVAVRPARHRDAEVRGRRRVAAGLDRRRRARAPTWRCATAC